ncbi:MAG: helix-turn-helix transcriptional regulator [Bacteroidota bacterium]
MSDKALSETIGSFVRKHRLDQNKTQSEIAEQAGISRSTLSLLEKGEAVTVPTLIQALRALELLHIMDNFQIVSQPSPLQLAKLEREKRQRARPDRKAGNQGKEW